MGNSKYLPEILEEITYVLENTGDKKKAIKAGGISKSTWLRWEKKEKGFKPLIKEALSFWRRTRSDRLVNRARHIEDELLSEDGALTEIVSSQVVTKKGDLEDIETRTRSRAPLKLVQDILASQESGAGGGTTFVVKIVGLDFGGKFDKLD